MANSALRCDAYTVLVDCLRVLTRAASTQAGLPHLADCLRDHCGIAALALEVTSGAANRYYPYGDVSALAQSSVDNDQTPWTQFACTLSDAAVPLARLTYVLPRCHDVPHDLLETIASQVGLKLGQDNLTQRADEAEDKTRQRLSEMAALYDIGRAIDPAELPRVLQMITERTSLLMDAQACSLMRMEGEHLRVAASHGLPRRGAPERMGDGPAHRVAQTGQPMLIVDAAHDARLDGLTLKPEIGSSMLVPMKDQEGCILGVLAIRRRRPAPDFTEEDLKLFSVFATQAALAIANVQLYSDLQKRASELLKLATLSQVLTSTLHLDELLAHVAHEVCAVGQFARCCLYIRDATHATYVPRIWEGYPDTIGRNPVRETEGVIGYVSRRHVPLTYHSESGPEQSESERVYLQMKGFARSLGVQAFVAVPILTAKERCIGVLVADNKPAHAPIAPAQLSLLTGFVSQAGVAIENARLWEEMQDNYRNLQKFKNYTDSIVRSIGSAIISTDAQGRIARWNRAAEDTLRLPGSAARGETLENLLQTLNLPAGQHGFLLDALAQVQATGERAHIHKYELSPQGREPLTLNLTISRLADHDQERAGIVLAFEDVTQEARLEAELEKVRRLADIGQLAAKMAHEVRNALSPIKGAAQMVRDDLKTQGESVEWPDIIISEVDDLTRLTNEMLDFARPMSLDLRVLQLNEFVRTALQTLTAFLHEYGVSLHWNLADNLPAFLADPSQMGQVVRNLTMNAAQAMADGGRLTIATRFDEEQQRLQLDFRDNGEGIPAAQIEQIFRPFVTTRTKGTGLGLPIVQKIVDTHGGAIKVESEPGAGTLFRILLPLKPDTRRDVVPEPPLISPKPAGPFPDN